MYLCWVIIILYSIIILLLYSIIILLLYSIIILLYYTLLLLLYSIIYYTLLFFRSISSSLISHPVLLSLSSSLPNPLIPSPSSSSSYSSPFISSASPHSFYTCRYLYTITYVLSSSLPSQIFSPRVFYRIEDGCVGLVRLFVF